MSYRLTLPVTLVACILAGAARGEEAPAFRLYPLKGVFGLSGTSSDGPSLVDERFVQALGQEERDSFAATFRRRFPESVEKLDDSNKRRTFAVSLQVTRASCYTVAKPEIRSVDLLLPMTASVYFTNVLTGEVLLSATTTIIPRGTVTEDQARPDSPRIGELYRRYFHELIDELIGEVRRRFRPRTVTATVQKDWKGLAVLDVGSNGGVQIDDSLEDDQGNELRVVWSALGYSVARVELGKFQTGAKFSRMSNGTLAEIQRPRVLPLIEETPKGLPREAILQLFGDALGESSPVSLMPVNPTFGEVLKEVAAEAEISQEELKARALPGLFVRLRVREPVSLELPTDKGYKRRRWTEATVLAEVQDTSGRVLFASVARNRVEDEVVAGIALDVASRREVVIKNALVDLARKFSVGFRPRSLELPVRQANGDTFTVDDPQGVLPVGRNLRVFRKIGQVNKVEVRVPVWDAEVTGALERAAEGRAVLPVVRGEANPKPGDVVLLEGVDAPVASRRRFGPCGHVEKLGAIELPEYEALALNRFAASYGAPYYAPGLAEQVATLVQAGTGFAQELSLKETAPDLCVEPVYRIDPLPESCSGAFCADVATVRLTYRIRTGGPQGEIKVKRGLETKMRATALPRESDAEARAGVLRLDLVDEVLKLAPQIATGFAQEAL